MSTSFDKNEEDFKDISVLKANVFFTLSLNNKKPGVTVTNTGFLNYYISVASKLSPKVLKGVRGKLFQKFPP